MDAASSTNACIAGQQSTAESRKTFLMLWKRFFTLAECSLPITNRSVNSLPRASHRRSRTDLATGEGHPA